MTTSGTSTFNLTRDQIIKSALRKVGAIESSETPSASMVSDCAEALNMMVKEWDTLGIHLWTEAEGALFLQPGQYQYSLGTGSTDHGTQTNPPNYTQTSLDAAAVAGATSITVDSIANILNGDNIGVVLDSGDIFWTTVSGSPSGVTVNLASGLTSAAASGNNVYDYTTAILRPLRIAAARRMLISSGIETPMVRMSRLDYRDLPNKANTGIPTQFFYDPLGGAINYGIIYIWPAPVDATNLVKFTWYRQIQDFNAAGNTPDFPQEWLNALVWNLAVEMAPEFDLTPTRFAVLKTQAKEKLDMVTGWDREPESIYFGVSYDQPYAR